MDTLIKTVQEAITAAEYSIKYHQEKLQSESKYHSESIANLKAKIETLQTELSNLHELIK